MSEPTETPADDEIVDETATANDELAALLDEANAEAEARRQLLERASSHPEPPYDTLDPPVVALVRALNQLPGIYTGGSCGGHAEPVSPVSAPANEWWIGLGLASVLRDGDYVPVPTDESWLSLEFLAWFVRDAHGSGISVSLEAASAPPWMNTPGETLGFQLSGHRDGETPCEPDELADRLTRLAIRYYVPADFAWRGDSDEPPDTDS